MTDKGPRSKQIGSTREGALRLEDDDAFTTAEGMQTGVVSNTGNLRIILTMSDGAVVPVELPNAWLRGHGGLAHFIQENVPVEVDENG